jgi:carbonic anhydrase
MYLCFLLWLQGGNCTFEKLAYEISPYNVGTAFEEGCAMPTMTLANGEVYTALKFHLHLRSEHTIDGEFWPAELHIVHKGENDFAVVSTFLQIFNDINNPVLEPYLDGWLKTAEETNESCKANKTETEGSSIAFSEGDIIGSSNGGEGKGKGKRNKKEKGTKRKRRVKKGIAGRKLQEIANPYDLLSGSSYYYYYGSLTTPPCTEAVNWHVTDIPLSISVLQYAKLVDLEHDYIDPVTCEYATLQSLAGDTNRPVQDLNGRNVTYYCA